MMQHFSWQDAIDAVVVSTRFVLKIGCGLLVSCFVCACDLTGQSSVTSTLTREERLKIAGDAFFDNQCKNQWTLLWPMAREGDGEALSELAFELGTRLEIPASDSDMKVDPEHRSLANVLVMTIYAATASKHPDRRMLHYIFDPARWNKGDIPVVSIRSGQISYSSIKTPPPVLKTKLENCLSQANASNDGDRCVAQAIELGLIPSFSEYSKAMDAIPVAYRPNHCLPRR